MQEQSILESGPWGRLEGKSWRYSFESPGMASPATALDLRLGKGY